MRTPILRFIGWTRWRRPRSHRTLTLRRAAIAGLWSIPWYRRAPSVRSHPPCRWILSTRLRRRFGRIGSSPSAKLMATDMSMRSYELLSETHDLRVQRTTLWWSSETTCIKTMSTGSWRGRTCRSRRSSALGTIRPSAEEPGGSSPCTKAFYREVQAINRGLPPGRRLRIVLGNPPVDWERVDLGVSSGDAPGRASSGPPTRNATTGDFTRPMSSGKKSSRSGGGRWLFTAAIT